MQEVFEDIIDYLKGIWLKRRYIIIATWLICPVGWYLVSIMPNVYKSEARVYVDTQSLLRPLLKGLTVETNPNIQINLMVKTLLSRPNLERIARMTDLDVQANTPEEFEIIIKGLKEKIKISSGGRENIYTLSIQHKDPEMAKNIVQSALTVFIENTLGDTRNDSDSAQKFLDAQIKDRKNELLARDARLTNFKQRNSDVLPGQSGGYYNKLNSSKEQLKAINLEILEKKTQLESAKLQLSQSVNTKTTEGNEIKSETSIQTTFDDRISELETQLDGLSLRYTDKHPDVVEVTRSLTHLKKQRSDEIKKYLELRSGDDGTLNRLSTNPVIQEVQIQINTLENQIASLNVRASDYHQQVIDLEGKIHTLPEVEAKFKELTRDYELKNKEYLQLISRRATAQLAQEANETTDKIQFKVIDPPRAATKPSGPARFVLFGVVTVLGLGTGVALSFLMSQLSPVATSVTQLAKVTGVPIFGVVSANANLGLQNWNRKKTFIFIASNIMLLLVLSAFISYFLFPDAIQAPLKRIF
ncbi:chain length determinant family protein [Colwellia sp. D2M02]|uniref:Wzz/FepE/Etk N-terminal domain-containing protein n=1 Tax=Colwellia asteriadis TaxID=517723 RepID=A0ABN1L7H5_9GAMM|nr:XrtA system polysaccharide chain length determinant [Colwellia sp. D2M02]MBU2894695.1 chain length determinant family protein [Colwellia sp. D2M02]